MMYGERTEQAQLLKSGPEQFQKELKTAFDEIGGGVAGGIKDVITSWNSTADPNRPHTAADKLNADLANYGKAWTAAHPAGAPGAAGATSDMMTNRYKFDATTFEKMGFVMGGNPMKRTEDLLTQIARNTSHLHQFQGTGGTLGGLVEHAL
jgi:hypothetical protein